MPNRYNSRGLSSVARSYNLSERRKNDSSRDNSPKLSRNFSYSQRDDNLSRSSDPQKYKGDFQVVRGSHDVRLPSLDHALNKL